jgi:hypothetical protein
MQTSIQISSLVFIFFTPSAYSLLTVFPHELQPTFIQFFHQSNYCTQNILVSKLNLLFSSLLISFIIFSFWVSFSLTFFINKFDLIFFILQRGSRLLPHVLEMNLLLLVLSIGGLLGFINVLCPLILIKLRTGNVQGLLKRGLHIEIGAIGIGRGILLLLLLLLVLSIYLLLYLRMILHL